MLPSSISNEVFWLNMRCFKFALVSEIFGRLDELHGDGQAWCLFVPMPFLYEEIVSRQCK